MGLRVTQVYKKIVNEDTGVKRHKVDHLDISFIQKIDEKNSFTNKLLDKIEYLNSISIKGAIEVEHFADEVFINGTLKAPPDTQKVITEIVNCLDALESLKKKEE